MNAATWRRNAWPLGAGRPGADAQFRGRRGDAGRFPLIYAKKATRATRGGCAGRWWCTTCPGRTCRCGGRGALLAACTRNGRHRSRRRQRRPATAFRGPAAGPRDLDSRSQHWYRVRDLHPRRPLRAEGSPICAIFGFRTRAVPDALQEPGHRFRRLRERLLPEKNAVEE